MLIQIMKSKIHRVKITQANVDYIGSITIDPVLMNAANIVAGEKVQVLNVSNGEIIAFGKSPVNPKPPSATISIGASASIGIV